MPFHMLGTGFTISPFPGPFLISIMGTPISNVFLGKPAEVFTSLAGLALLSRCVELGF